jgi:hypothetical protein
MTKVTRMGLEDFDKAELGWVLSLGANGYTECVGDAEDLDGSNFFFASEKMDLSREDYSAIIDAYLELQPGGNVEITLPNGLSVIVECF